MENETTEVKENDILSEVEPAESAWPGSGFEKLSSMASKFDFFSHKKFFAMALVVILFITILFLLSSRDRSVAVKQFTNVYSFVPEKISKSAAIQINLPEEVDEDSARRGITFSPEIAGSWQTEEIEKVVIFKPEKPLRSGVYYAVNMDTEAVQMSGDFFVDEDPAIEAIFPAQNSETPEDSEITIVFNRPMVPLTTLSEQELIDLPISIYPETAGRFKWISTRNLQFIPDTTLIPSSEYRVEVKSGLYSVDGLPIAPVTHNFVTRPLRYEFISSGQIGFKAPIIISFNQPVDLDKTKKQISVSRDGGQVGIEVEYGETTFYDYSSRKYKTETDQSKLFVYQKKDSHGRSNLWDFETTYRVTIDGAVPLSGTKDLSVGKNSTVNVPNIVEQVTAESDRTSLVRPDLLDPKGTLTVRFYEDIDKNRSDINVKGLRSIEYGERCKTDVSGEPIQLGNNCEKEADTRTIIISFDASKFSTDESFSLELKKIYTKDNFLLNANPLNVSLKTYPTFRIISTNIEDKLSNAPVDGLLVCTNTPLKKPEESLSQYIKTDGYIVYGRWSQSQYIEEVSSYTYCKLGEFQTNLLYGLLPEKDYGLNISLSDVFDQNENKQFSFKTGMPNEKYTRIHNLQEQYNVTPSDRTKLTYAAENLEYVDVHICRMEPETFLERIYQSHSENEAPFSDGCTQVVNKKIELPPKYWVNNYFQINLADYFVDTRGHYLITLTNPLYRSSYDNKQLYDRTFVSVTNLAVGRKQIEYSDENRSYSKNPAKEKVLDKKLQESKNLFWVNNSKTLEPINGATVTQYELSRNDKPVRRTSGYTDVQGVARVPVNQNTTGAVIRSGFDTAVVSDWADLMSYADNVQDASKTYVYTDRPIYRPGHTVYIRGIDRIGFDGEYEIWNKEPVKLKLYDAKRDKIYETELEISDYGTFDTEFELPSDAALGNYRINAFGHNFSFSVEEYVPAAFKLETESNQEEYVNGDTMKLSVQADYYFGVPLDSGTVIYAVTAQDYYFDRYTDEYFNFGSAWYYCYSCGYGDDFLFRGETKLDENGHATIEREINLNDYFDDIESERSKLVTVSIVAKDINGRSVSQQKSFIVHKGEFYLGGKTDSYYTSVNTPVNFRVKSVDVTGKPQSLKNIEKTVSKVSWETFKRQEVDGGFYYRSEKTLTEISHENIQTDDNGDWGGEISFPEEGQYEIQVSKTDNRGNKIKTVSNIYIYGPASISVPPNNNYTLDLEIEKPNVKVGDTATVLIKSPYDKAKLLITTERGTIYDYWIADIKGGLYLHEFPVKDSYAPNVFVSVLLLSPNPEIKYGSAEFTVDGEQNELKINVKSNKTIYLPGEEVTLDVETKDYTGKPVQAEVSLAVADLSVLALKGNPKKNPSAFFFKGFPLFVSTASNIKNILYEVDIPLGTKGGGGSNPDDLAKKKRGLFKDTAFWQASLVTNTDGKGSATFTLPDNLTTWQVESLGVTKDTKIGVDYSEFTTKKDLMAVPLKPRFIIPGDTFSLGAKIFNQTENDTTVKVTLESETLKFKGEQEDSVSVKKGESKTVYFEVEAPKDIKAGKHVFTFTASDDTFTDSVEQVIPITPNKTYETVATANFTKNDSASEYLYIPKEVISDEGGLTINANATMAVFMTDALSYMVTYPYGCSEQLASSLSTIAILKQALTLPNVKGEFESMMYEGVTYSVDDVVTKGLSNIYQTQSLYGGFSYYKGYEPDLFLTMHVVLALGKLRDAGYEVREDVLRRGRAYIESQTTKAYTSYPDQNQETVILAEYVLQTVGDGNKSSLSKILDTYITDASFLNEKISSMSLAYLSIITSNNYSRGTKKQVYEALKNRIDIDGRGAYLKSGNNRNFDYFETSIKNTALLLKVFAAQQDENTNTANLLHWLLAGRDKDGVWGGTHNTFIVVDAMVDYLKWQHETESRFTLHGILDGAEIFGFDFNADNIFETMSHYIPVGDIKKEKLLPLVFERENHNEQRNNFYYDISLKYFLPAASLPPRDEGITIARNLFALSDTRDETPLTEVVVGDVVRGKLSITIPSQYSKVAIEDYIPAGFEIVNFNLDTEDKSLLNKRALGSSKTSVSTSLFSSLSSLFGGSQSAQLYRNGNYSGGSYGNKERKLRPSHIESHDDRVFLFNEQLSPGVYEYEYYLRALVPGEFQYLPARAEQLYFPEVFGRTEGGLMKVIPAQ